ncbi:hypothetical protein AM571_CH01456 [Rhizobium etli 8C-3]|uniref:Uncharacterized protein n=1 Tax=Rhizobium etli 8C-3 TaxID=538025 RepID=A0A1L5P2G2_RHIET|nr:hypothetical protein [Rhizobium etli]APO74291.1 hypothetical protein AM571_CH01456 [Rhizobium etli 8C-3]
MAQEDDDTLEATGTLGTPKQRARSLIRSIIPAVAFGLGAMAVSYSLSAVVTGWLITSTPVEHFRQLPEGDATRIVAQLRGTSENLAYLQKLVASQPDAAANAEKAQADVNAVIHLLDSLPVVESRAEVISLPSLVTQAVAQEIRGGKTSGGSSVQDIIALGLTGFIALMLLVFTVLYFRTEDKSKKVFAEKIITSIVGFLFGLATGSVSGRGK